MSIVAWDGKTLATDRLGDAGDLKRDVAKSRVSTVHECILAWTGGISEGMRVANWYDIEPSKRGEFPACQNNDRWCRLIIADASGAATIEQEPVEIDVLEPFMAWGSGRDYALGAMAMGANARQAVVVACRFAFSCGLGIDVWDLATLEKIERIGGNHGTRSG